MFSFWGERKNDCMRVRLPTNEDGSSEISYLKKRLRDTIAPLKTLKSKGQANGGLQKVDGVGLAKGVSEKMSWE